MSVVTSDEDTAKLYVQIFRPKHLNISARMSSSISEILKPFKKLAVLCYQVKNSRLRHEFLNLIIHSCSFFK